MLNYKFIPEPDDWTESIPLSVMSAVRDNHEQLFKLFAWYGKHAGRYMTRISTMECLREVGLTMPRGKKTDGTAKNNGGNNNSRPGGDAKWVWGNCRLSDEDIAYLDGSTDTLEYLATCLIALGNDGYGFTCKPVDKGESHCCTVFRPDYPSDGVTIGVSAFGGNIRDAILSCLYKLDTYGGGDFTGFDVASNSAGTKPRFR